MRTYWSSALLAILFFSCSSKTADKTNLLSKIPEDCSIILKLNNLESLSDALKNNQLVSEFKNQDSLKVAIEQMEPLKYFQTNNPVYLGIKNGRTDSLNLTLVTKQRKDLLNFGSIQNLLVDTIYGNKTEINQIQLGNNSYYFTTNDSIFFLSNKLSLTQNFLISNYKQTKAKELFDTANTKKNFSVFISKDLSGFTILRDSTPKTFEFSDYTMLDIELNGNDIYVNGITEPIAENRFINCFKESIPQENRMAQICPTSTHSFVSYTSQDMNLINSRFQNLIENDSTEYIGDLHNIVEFGNAQIENSEISILRSLDVDMTFEELGIEGSNNVYRNVTIYNAEASEAIKFNKLPLLKKIKPKYLINLDEFLIFSEEQQVLKTIISNYQNGNTLSKSQSYKELMQNLSDEASILIYEGQNAIKKRLLNLFDISTPINTDPYKASAIQFVYETNFAHVNAVLKTLNNNKSKKAVTEILNLNMDAQIYTPQFVRNHTNNQMDLLVQDINNNLYLISNKGKVFWKKNIDEKILGKVQQIDMYKNGRLQLVFATKSRIYVIDRNGNDATPFPLKFSDEITQPLSVFDYEKNRNYRLLLTQGKELIMFDQRGNRVNGFNYKGAEKNISTQPKHIRIGRRDYITFSQGNKIEILSRVGKTRVDIKSKFLFSDNDIYLYNNKFVTTNSNGELLEIKTNGRVDIKNLNLNENHKLTATSKTLVTLTDNRLTIRSKSIELNYGNYSEPKIFYLSNKIYVSVTDLQSNKVYLFDSQGETISGFPIYGNSSIDMQHADEDKKLEILTKGDKNSIIIYELN